MSCRHCMVNAYTGGIETFGPFINELLEKIIIDTDHCADINYDLLGKLILCVIEGIMKDECNMILNEYLFWYINNIKNKKTIQNHNNNEIIIIISLYGKYFCKYIDDLILIHMPDKMNIRETQILVDKFFKHNECSISGKKCYIAFIASLCIMSIVMFILCTYR